MTIAPPSSLLRASILLGLMLACAACSPTIRLQVPDKPIVINLNVKIEQEVRVRLEKDVDEMAKAKPGVF